MNPKTHTQSNSEDLEARREENLNLSPRKKRVGKTARREDGQLKKFAQKRDKVLGKRFGKWTVVRIIPPTDGKSCKAECKCDCGTVGSPQINRLVAGKTLQCKKCASAKSKTKHGMIKSPTWCSWQAMKQRCLNPKGINSQHYIGRGIKVCDRWMNSFIDFYHDMGERPSKKHSLDRINNNGDYEPNNCRWALPRVQRLNTRSTFMVTWEGQDIALAELCEKLGANYKRTYVRIHDLGWDLSKAILTPKLSFKEAALNNWIKRKQNYENT